MGSQVVKKLIARSIRSPGQVPETLKREVEELYDKGVLGVYCSGYERVGPNYTLHEKLEEWYSDHPPPREGKKARKEKKRKAPEPEAIETVQQEVPKKRRKKNKLR